MEIFIGTPILWEGEMALRPQYSLINSEFNDFLYATIGIEKNGNDLTVLSAMTRLDLDPWGEAARLSELPRESAINQFAGAIAGLPEGDWKAAEAGEIALRLVERLPKRGPLSGLAPQVKGRWVFSIASVSRPLLFCLALTVIVLVVMLTSH